jgi:hypothetical protein
VSKHLAVNVLSCVHLLAYLTNLLTKCLPLMMVGVAVIATPLAEADLITTEMPPTLQKAQPKVTS